MANERIVANYRAILTHRREQVRVLYRDSTVQEMAAALKFESERPHQDDYQRATVNELANMIGERTS